MKTEWVTEKELSKAVDFLTQGEVVAFPTETVYGLGADATNEMAVKKIFAAKQRPNDNPLIVHVSNLNQVNDYAQDIPQKARQVIKYFWPGPCTIILKDKGEIAPSVTAGLHSVAFRMPDHPLALKLIEKTTLPLAAPSANSSGKPSPTLAEHVKQDLDGKIKAIVEGGQTGVGLESTVLDLTDPEKSIILRPGGISKEQLEDVIGEVKVANDLKEKNSPKSPGMKYLHYAPNEPVWIVKENWGRAIEMLRNKGENVGLLASEDVIKEWVNETMPFFSLGAKHDVASASRLLYKGLRSFEETKATVILAESLPKKGIGQAYMNRLEKAADNKWL